MIVSMCRHFTGTYIHSELQANLNPPKLMHVLYLIVTFFIFLIQAGSVPYFVTDSACKTIQTGGGKSSTKSQSVVQQC